MPLLIDGYNLLHVSGVFGRGTALTELHRSREALLEFLAASIEPAERNHTTIVFDAAGAPPGLPQRFTYEGIHVEFARDSGNADALLETLIAAHQTPRSLVVVSSDHRVQRAARRRRATAIDSDRWLAELRASAHERKTPAESPPKPSVELSSEEVAYWLGQFTQPAETPGAANPTEAPDDLDDPFPPGYADDLLDEDGGG